MQLTCALTGRKVGQHGPLWPQEDHLGPQEEPRGRRAHRGGALRREQATGTVRDHSLVPAVPVCGHKFAHRAGVHLHTVLGFPARAAAGPHTNLPEADTAERNATSTRSRSRRALSSVHFSSATLPCLSRARAAVLQTRSSSTAMTETAPHHLTRIPAKPLRRLRENNLGPRKSAVGGVRVTKSLVMECLV